MAPRRRRSTRRRSVRSRAPTTRRRAPRRTTRRTRAPARSTRGQGGYVSNELGVGTKFALAQIDPFHPQCLGAKIPDSNTQPSIAVTDMETTNLTSANTTFVHAMAFRPAYDNGTVLATSGLGAVVWPLVWAGTPRSKRASYVAAIEINRPVAHAIRISSPLAPTSATGFAHICLSTETTFNVSTWQFPTTISQMSGCQYYKRVTIASLTQTPLTVINKWIDDTAFRYTSPESGAFGTTSGELQTDLSWATIIVMVEGAPVGTPLSFEHILLTEAIPQKTGVILGNAAAASSPGTISSVSQMSAVTEPFHTEAGQESYMAQASAALADGAREQGAQVFQNVAVPILHQAGAAGMNMASAAFLNLVGGRTGELRMTDVNRLTAG